MQHFLDIRRGYNNTCNLTSHKKNLKKMHNNQRCAVVISCKIVMLLWKPLEYLVYKNLWVLAVQKSLKMQTLKGQVLDLLRS